MHGIVRRIPLHGIHIQLRGHDVDPVLLPPAELGQLPLHQPVLDAFPSPARVLAFVVGLECPSRELGAVVNPMAITVRGEATRKAAMSFSALVNIVSMVASGFSGLAPKQSLMPSRKVTTSGFSSPPCSLR